MNELNIATASLEEISDYAQQLIPLLNEHQQKRFAKEVRMRYRDFSFPDLLTALVEDANGSKPLHPICKRAMFRVMRRNVANMVGDVANTPFGHFAEPLSDIKPLHIKRKECGSAIEDVWDCVDVAFDVGKVGYAYYQIVQSAYEIAEHAEDASMSLLFSVIFLEKHGVIAPNPERTKLISEEFVRRRDTMLADLNGASLDDLGALLSLYANKLVDLTNLEFNRLGNEVRERIIKMIHKVVAKFASLHHYVSVEELCEDALAKVFVQAHSYCPAHGSFTTWAWTTATTVLTASYADMGKNAFIIPESKMTKHDEDDVRRFTETAANEQTLRDYERQTLIQHIQSVADVLLKKMPHHAPIIRAVFGDHNGVATDDLDFVSIARRSSRLAGKEQSSSYVRRIFLNDIRPAFIREFSN